MKFLDSSKIPRNTGNCNLGVFLPCLLGFIVAMSTGCFDAYDVAELKVEREGHLGTIEELKLDLKNQKERVAELEGKASKAVTIQKEIEKLLAEQSNKEKEINEFELELGGAMNLLAAAQSSFKVKTTLTPGEKFDSIKLKNGKELRNAVFRNFDLTQGLYFSHSAGSGKFSISEMPEMIEKRIILSPPEPLAEADPRLLLKRRPNSLKSSERLQKEADQAQNESAIALKKKEALEEKEMAAQEKDARDEADEKAAMALKFQQQIDALKNQLSSYQANYDEILRQKNAQLNSWNNMKLPPAQADRQKTLDTYDSNGRAIAQKIATLEVQISQLDKKRSN